MSAAVSRKSVSVPMPVEMVLRALAALRRSGMQTLAAISVIGEASGLAPRFVGQVVYGEAPKRTSPERARQLQRGSAEALYRRATECRRRAEECEAMAAEIIRADNRAITDEMDASRALEGAGAAMARGHMAARPARAIG
jgi:hypothetical protein